MRVSPLFFEALFRRPSIDGCVPRTNHFCHVVNALHETLSSEKNQTDINYLIDSIPEAETLDWLLVLGLQEFAMFAMNNPEILSPDVFDVTIPDLLRIRDLLATNGTTAVTWRDLKPYARKALAFFDTWQYH
ncbi:unnamed protein product [Rotaria socialis]|uniref:Uncharacterized protein n=1 Tax=Rotaria socialis TaxID=392032 RepID=A0A818WKQ7_9BILA|nr:unnamed protein product [Rotaria socialis]